jgi:hypothetical protein
MLKGLLRMGNSLSRGETRNTSEYARIEGDNTESNAVSGKRKRRFDMLRRNAEEQQFQEKFQKYLGRASSLQEPENYESKKDIEKTGSRIKRMDKWIVDNAQRLGPPATSYLAKKKIFTEEQVKMTSRILNKNLSSMAGSKEQISNNAKESFKNASIEFLKEIASRLQSSETGSSKQAGQSTTE